MLSRSVLDEEAGDGLLVLQPSQQENTASSGMLSTYRGRIVRLDEPFVVAILPRVYKSARGCIGKAFKYNLSDSSEDLTGRLNFIEENIRQHGLQLAKLQITEEPNLYDAPGAADG